MKLLQAFYVTKMLATRNQLWGEKRPKKAPKKFLEAKHILPNKHYITEKKNQRGNEENQKVLRHKWQRKNDKPKLIGHI